MPQDSGGFGGYEPPRENFEFLPMGNAQEAPLASLGRSDPIFGNSVPDMFIVPLKPPPKPIFDLGPNLDEFMASVRKTLVQQPDYRGCGGHDLQDHHIGPHTQDDIGMGKKGVNAAEVKIRWPINPK